MRSAFSIQYRSSQKKIRERIGLVLISFAHLQGVKK